MRSGDKIKDVLKERQSIYGDAHRNFAQTGRM